MVGLEGNFKMCHSAHLPLSQVSPSLTSLTLETSRDGPATDSLVQCLHTSTSDQKVRLGGARLERKPRYKWWETGLLFPKPQWRCQMF